MCIKLSVKTYETDIYLTEVNDNFKAHNDYD